jgi:hypothetical protein
MMQHLECECRDRDDSGGRQRWNQSTQAEPGKQTLSLPDWLRTTRTTLREKNGDGDGLLTAEQIPELRIFVAIHAHQI